VYSSPLVETAAESWNPLCCFAVPSALSPATSSSAQKIRETDTLVKLYHFVDYIGLNTRKYARAVNNH